MLNAGKLYDELKAAGIAVQSTDSTGIVLDLDGNQIQDRPDVAAVIAAHVPARSIGLSPSQQIILADGVDVAQVVITGEPGATVEYTVNGQPFETDLDVAGQDAIELTSDTPNTVIVVQAGTARAVVYAVEVPS